MSYASQRSAKYRLAWLREHQRRQDNFRFFARPGELARQLKESEGKRVVWSAEQNKMILVGDDD